MVRSVILLSFIIMNFSANLYAQEKGEGPVQWKIGAELPSTGNKSAPGVAGPVSGITNNMLIIAGGANFPDSMPWMGGKKKYQVGLYAYQLSGDSLRLVTSFNIPDPVAYAANCTTSKGIVYAGGENENEISNKVCLLLWDAQYGRVDIKHLPDLPVAITNAGAVAVNDLIFIGGGETANTVSDRFFCLDLNKPGAAWKELPHVPKPVSHATWIIGGDNSDRSIYVFGGRMKNATGISQLYNSVFMFDLAQQRWEEKASLPYALSAGTGIALDAWHIVIFGGDKGETFHETEKLMVAIRNEKNKARKERLIKQKNELQSGHPGFSRKILLYDVRNNEWTTAGCMPFETPVTTTAISWNGKVILPSGEIRAGVRTPRVLVGTIN